MRVLLTGHLFSGPFLLSDSHMNSALKVALIVCICTPLSLHAIGASVQPSKVEVSGFEGERIVEHVTVSNPSGHVALFDVSIDEWTEFVSVKPQSFTLQAGENRLVELAADLPSSGTYTTYVSIVARPLSDSVFQAGTGLKVPITLVSTTMNEKVVTSTRAGSSGMMTALLWMLAALNLVVLLFLQMYRVLRKGATVN